MNVDAFVRLLSLLSSLCSDWNVDPVIGIAAFINEDFYRVLTNNDQINVAVRIKVCEKFLGYRSCLISVA